MEKILLVEPNYKNKYPPLGLMKLATFHRARGDIVEFYKGEAPYTKISQVDRIYITTLFSFHYDITIKCINHYKKYISKDCIYIGGIAATILTSDFRQDTGIKNIIRGQVTDSSILGYDEKVNIDMLTLDYDILDDISYAYPSGDSYFIHTTRGCPRKCEFCAVKTLEPEYLTSNNVINQVKCVDEIYGQKRNLLIMDNNILWSDNLNEIINDIKMLGFTGDSNYVYPNPFNVMMNKIGRRISYKVDFFNQINELIEYLKKFSTRIKRYPKIYDLYWELLSLVLADEDTWGALQLYEKEIAEYIEKYRSKAKMIRYVDFNQGIDARLINEHNIEILSKIPIRPFRLAYDSVKETEIFFNATKMAMRHNVREFSNYMLYNWEDRPEDLWIRLKHAMELYGNNNEKISGFSFPMKYSPVDEKDRAYIGKHWNKKYLGAINIIINVTKGVVAKEKDFFFEAFGSNLSEYLMILNMPDEFIRFRHFFRDNGLLSYWKELYLALSQSDQEYLLEILCKSKSDRTIIYGDYATSIKKILVLYTINKSQFIRKEKNTESVIRSIEEIY